MVSRQGGWSTSPSGDTNTCLEIYTGPAQEAGASKLFNICAGRQDAPPRMAAVHLAAVREMNSNMVDAPDVAAARLLEGRAAADSVRSCEATTGGLRPFANLVGRSGGVLANRMELQCCTILDHYLTLWMGVVDPHVQVCAPPLLSVGVHCVTVLHIVHVSSVCVCCWLGLLFSVLISVVLCDV